MEPGVDVVVTNYRTAGDLSAFLASLHGWEPEVPHDVVVANVSPTRRDVQVASAWLEAPGRERRTVVPFADNVGYARACNRGASLGRREVVALFNADVRLTPGALDTCYDALIAHPSWAILGPRQVDDEGRLTAAGIFGTNTAPRHRGWHEVDRGQYTDVRPDAVTVSGAAFFVRRAVWDELTACPIFAATAEPPPEGAFLQTPHYYEETHCVPGDSFVWCVDGPRRVDAVSAGDLVWGFDAPARRLDAAPVTWAGPTGVKPTLLFTMRGRQCRVTADHVLPVVKGVRPNGSGGALRWLRADEVELGDRLVAATSLPPGPGLDTAPDGAPVSPDLAQLLGAYIGDGCMDGRGVTIAMPRDDRVRQVYEDLATASFMKATRWARRGTPSAAREYAPVVCHNAGRAFRFTSTEAIEQLRRWGFAGLAHSKRIPRWVFGLSRAVRLAFLAGVVDSDGHVNKAGQLVIVMANRALVEDIRQLLATCGLPVSAVGSVAPQMTRFPQGHGSLSREAFRITCAAPAEIPFADTLYRARVRPERPRRPAASMGASVGLGAGLVARRVVGIELHAPEPVYDLSVPGLESFVTDGVVVHNCSYHARAHGYQATYYGPVTIVHRWHKASPVGGWAEAQFSRSRRIFRAACDAHGILHD